MFGGAFLPSDLAIHPIVPHSRSPLCLHAGMLGDNAALAHLTYRYGAHVAGAVTPGLYVPPPTGGESSPERLAVPLYSRPCSVAASINTHSRHMCSSLLA